MTKKHFEWAAAYVRRVRGPHNLENPTIGAIQLLEDSLVCLFAEFNPRFDADRFRAACRGGD
jgi:hypothetical protein